MNALETVSFCLQVLWTDSSISSFPRINRPEVQASPYQGWFIIHRPPQGCILYMFVGIKPSANYVYRPEQGITTVGCVIINRLLWLAVLVVSLFGFVDAIQMHFKVCRSPFPRSEDPQLFEDPKSKKKKNRQHDIVSSK